jgi:hypothetical protein
MVVSDMRDSRLIGTWRSDTRKAALEIATRRDMGLAKNRKLVGLFGKLELRYTRRFCYFRFEDHESVSAYQVVAKDEYSAALVTFNSLEGKRLQSSHWPLMQTRTFSSRKTIGRAPRWLIEVAYPL